MREYLLRVGELQGRILLALSYLAVVGPIWVILRIARIRLLEQGRRGWRARTGDPASSMEEPF